MKIYTSYYANPILKTVSQDTLRAISVGLPKEMTCTKIKELAPDWATVSAYKDGKIDWNEYTRQYTAKLDALGVTKISGLLENGCVYLCFEGKGKNCHRHILADWLSEHASMDVQEL